ncbi:MAG: peroxiredoxin [Syntrophobacteraceae bacterium]|jgi:peroxiredoxin Q/BCP|nr:peroxiredoxin [Syntrophobacteraceae bacterium]
MLNAGSKAPDFCLTSHTGDEVCLKDLLGSWVVLYFYPKDNTSGCTTEALEFTGLMPRFGEAGVQVYGISPDSVESHGKFIGKHGLAVPLLSDPGHQVLESYGAWGKKKMYGKEFEGVIRSTVVIDPKGVIQLAWPSAKSKGHAAAVLEGVLELMG